MVSQVLLLTKERKICQMKIVGRGSRKNTQETVGLTGTRKGPVLREGSEILYSKRGRERGEKGT